MGLKVNARHSILAAAFAVLAFAQDPAATLVGTVADRSGALIAGAALEVRNADTDEIRRVETDANGEFVVPELPAGNYEVKVSRDGFRTLIETGLVLEIDQEARKEFKLDIGEVNQTVEVAATVPLINTDNDVKGEVMVSKEIVEMPLNGRDFTDLAALTPGVTPRQQGGNGSSWTINGARADNTNFVIDGFNDQNPRAASAQARPNLDALEEFKMQTTGYSAETGRLAGGVMNMVLKTGGNQFHGVAFEFARNEFADARGFFDDSVSRLRRHQFGGTLSGPVAIPHVYNGKDRTFFLFSWESQRQEQGSSKLGVVPTAAQRIGNFTAFGPIKDPLLKGACDQTSSAGCFPRNQI
ncbi:MAG: TonB-dependent receptor, partial [Acidobacteriaceae bacterium]|nr:TonB-dependent receptor [Acidobacteriaceae bacterium]